MQLYTPGSINKVGFTSFLNSLKVFPAPADNHVKFQFDYPPLFPTLIKLYTIMGQQICIYALSSTSMLDVNVSKWPSGDYLYRIEMKGVNNISKNGRFSVVH